MTTSNDTHGSTPTMRGGWCGFRFPDGSECVFGAYHRVGYHHSENGEDLPGIGVGPAAAVAPPDTDYDVCGTYAGYQRHKHHGTEPCEQCKRANADYTRNRRATNNEDYAKHAQRAAVRSRALTRLGRRHPSELDALIRDEMRKLDTQGGERS